MGPSGRLEKGTWKASREQVVTDHLKDHEQLSGREVADEIQQGAHRGRHASTKAPFDPMSQRNSPSPETAHPGKTTKKTKGPTVHGQETEPRSLVGGGSSQG